MNLHKLLRFTQRVYPRVTSQHRFNQIQTRTTPNYGVETIRCFRRASSSLSPDSVSQESLVKRILKKIPFLAISKTELKAIAYLHYEKIADNINYIEFFDELDLPDTFYSWFTVTELHMWMIAARAMAEGNEGRFIRNNMVEALWSDVFSRVKKLGGAVNPSETRQHIVELSQQLQATFIAYDEGLQGSDVVLAGALWRRFYQQGDVDLEQIEMLVKYVRKNMRMLESLSSQEFHKPKDIKWILLSS